MHSILYINLLKYCQEIINELAVLCLNKVGGLGPTLL